MIEGHKRLPPLPVRHPDLVLEWHPTKNSEYSPDQLTENSKYQEWWQCSKNAEAYSALPLQLIDADASSTPPIFEGIALKRAALKRNLQLPDWEI